MLIKGTVDPKVNLNISPPDLICNPDQRQNVVNFKLKKMRVPYSTNGLNTLGHIK